jgi:hypothetical protein
MKTPWMAATLASALLVQAFPGSTQGVFKWVDADGKTHYGQQPPAADKGPEPVKLHSASGFGGNNNETATRTPTNPDGTKKIPKEIEDMRDDLVKGLKKVDPKTESLSCATAVDNVRSQFDTMLEVGQRNTKDGYITQAEFDATAAKLRHATSEATLGDCEGSSGNKRAFYQCMSGRRNHISGCGFKHKF